MSALINVNILHTPQAKMIGRQYGLSINIRIYSYTASYTRHMYISHQPFGNHVNLIGPLQKRRSPPLRHIRCEGDCITCICAVHMQCVEHVAECDVAILTKITEISQSILDVLQGTTLAVAETAISQRY